MQPDLAKLVKAKPGDEKSPLPRSSGKFAGFFDLFVLLLSLFFAVAFVFAINAMCKSRILDARNSNPVSSYPFNADSAINHIRKIGAKPRFVSSAALEESMQYIKTELEKVQSVAEANGMHLDVDLFRSDPDTFSTSIGNIYILNSYDNLTSVVARLRPANMPFETDEKTLLLNAHVDSAIGSPGANDNVVGAGVIMEIVSTIAALPAHVNKLNRPIVFLFNGAEEVILAGAHSFIKQHRFAKNIAAHINLESLGPGDSYNLFRLGPNSPWLAEAYANAVSIPTGSVTATDVFNSKVSSIHSLSSLFSSHALYSVKWYLTIFLPLCLSSGDSCRDGLPHL